MLQALIPVKGVYIRLLLQDLELDDVAAQRDTVIVPGTKLRDRALLRPSELLVLYPSVLDRALVAVSRVEDPADVGCRDDEEEVIFVILRALMLLLVRRSTALASLQGRGRGGPCARLD